MLILNFGKSTVGPSTCTMFQPHLVPISSYNKAGHGFGTQIQNHRPACTETDPSSFESQPPYKLAKTILKRSEVREGSQQQIVSLPPFSRTGREIYQDRMGDLKETSKNSLKDLELMNFQLRINTLLNVWRRNF